MSSPSATALAPANASDAWKRVSDRHRWLAGFLLSIGNFMVFLDLTIANVSVPHISGNLGISLDQGTWIITSYAVAEAVSVPLTGWLSQRIGTVRFFLLSMAGFSLCSLLCGMSVSLGMLVAARIGQGLCGGPLMPLTQTLMLRLFPPEKRAAAMTLWAMTVIAAPALGPIVGGLISDQISWHWIFFINVPIAVPVLLVVYALLRPIETPVRSTPIDRGGLALLVFWIGCLQILLDTGRDHDWFGDWRIVMLAVGAAVGFAVFIIWELTEPHPVVDLRVFRHRGFSALCITQMFCFGSFFAGIVVIPQWLQTSLGYSATMAGLITASNAIIGMFFAGTVARLVTRVDLRMLISGGAVGLSITGFIRASWWTNDVDVWSLLWPIMLQGITMQFLMIPIATAGLSDVAREETASAAGLQNFVRTMSIAVATSVVLTYWDHMQKVLRAGLVGRLDEAPMRAALARAGFAPQQTTLLIDQLLQKEVVSVALNNVFAMIGVFSLIGGLLVWLVPRRLPGQAGAAAAGH